MKHRLPRTSGRTLLRSGFTLIELLIVVAIIAILAAIAVPNFLEAQTRAKVSRVKADVRSFATAMETYIVDNNKIFRTSRATGETRTFINSKLTTPIAYLTSIMPDPFNLFDKDPFDRVIVLWGPDYIQARTARATIFSPYRQLSDGTNFTGDINTLWVCFSAGPNKRFDAVNQSTAGVTEPMPPYDSTNGTISDGDVLRSNALGQM
jgi:prepilin-type N-terminal cleavage/methylation domain-containing protein